MTGGAGAAMRLETHALTADLGVEDGVSPSVHLAARFRWGYGRGHGPEPRRNQVHAKAGEYDAHRMAPSSVDRSGTPGLHRVTPGRTVANV